MAVLRQIAQLGNPVLRETAKRVELPSSPVIRTLVDDMIATMRDADGVGIAAPQVYESIALFIVASRANPRYPDAPEMEPEVVINPEVVESSIEMVNGREGCLSIPGLRGNVPRHQRIRVRYSTLDGEMIDREFDGFIARIFQHEFDHLSGVVFLDRMVSTKEIMMEREYRKILVT
jgi:peptide deformylase